MYDLASRLYNCRFTAVTSRRKAGLRSMWLLSGGSSVVQPTIVAIKSSGIRIVYRFHTGINSLFAFPVSMKN